jgi:4-hydroxy-3-polyprenylbenzoate decarboxylase
MPHNGLADFLEALEQDGELVRIEVEVDPGGELSEIARRACESLASDGGGPALLFTRVAGHDWPVVANLFGTESRLARGLGASSSEELAERLENADQPAANGKFFDRLRRFGVSGKPSTTGSSRIVKTARCQQVVELGRDVDLSQLPLARLGVDGERAAITAAQIVAREPGAAAVAVSNAPAVVLGPNQLGLVWYPSSELARCLSLAQQRGEAFPVAITIGACPSLAIAGEAPLPPGWCPQAYAAALRASPVDLVKARTQPIEVSADAEIVFEGVIDPGSKFVELGDFITPLGQWAPRQTGPVVEVTAVTHRANPVLPVRVPGWPWHEQAVLRRMSLRLLLPAARQLAPDLADYDAPLFAGGRTLFVAIRKRFAGHAAQVAAALWGWPPMAGVKLTALVDEDIDVRDPARVWGQVAAECDPARDLFQHSVPADPLDPASGDSPIGQAIAIDATRKLAGERSGSTSGNLHVPTEILERVARRWEQYGLAPIAKEARAC